MKNEEQATVLVVDDDPINCRVLAQLLTLQGYTVVKAADGCAALQTLDDEQVDLVLLDVMMPCMDGFETCRRIREERRDLLLPVLFVTAMGDQESRVKGQEVGANDFLTKPVDPVELSARVRNLLRAKAYHDLRARQQLALEEELAQAREQLLRADRLATLGTLAAGVGHELGNIATILSTARQLIQARMEQGEEPAVVPAIMDSLISAERHVKTHARHLLACGRPGPDHSEELDLSQVVRQTLEMLHVSGKIKYIDVDLELPDAPVRVTINRTRIEQVLVNLVGNAADALAGVKGREPRIRVAVEAPDAADRIVCQVEDNGGGIDEAQQAAIFEPYHTTKAPGKGTGLGLSVTREIIRSYGGDVRLRSMPDRGTTFTFDLPGS